MYRLGLTLILKDANVVEYVKKHGDQLMAVYKALFETVYSEVGLRYFIEYCRPATEHASGIYTFKSSEIESAMDDIIEDILQSPDVEETLVNLESYYEDMQSEMVSYNASYGVTDTGEISFTYDTLYCHIQRVLINVLNEHFTWNINNHSVGELTNLQVIGPDTVALEFAQAP